MYNENLCKKTPIEIYGNGLPNRIWTIAYTELTLHKKINLSVPYEWEGLHLEFSANQKATLDKKWWLIMETNSGMLAKIIWHNSYDLDSMESFKPEWADYIDTIWWKTSPQQRYPYNTVYVSSDLLLHSFHKLFSNTLKEYESTIARNILGDTIDSSLSTFSALSKSSSSTLKPYYDYLTAYRSIAKILLPNQQEMETLLAMPTDPAQQEKRFANMDQSDLKDEYLKSIILQRANSIIKKYPTVYDKALLASVSAIVSGMDKWNDFLAEAFSPQSDPNFVIIQDYTQFVPRGYYTDNSYLRTYFMSMKRLMKHKMYLRDAKMTEASLIMAHDFPKAAQKNIEKLQEFMRKMIGADDDITLADIQGFIVSKNMKNDANIVKNYTPDWSKEIAALRPQKIISTSYITQSKSSVTEAEAKNTTAWFVFFGEKFTSDGRIMDELTAWSAEIESAKKPEVVSVYQIWDTMMWWLWSQYALWWLQNNKKAFGITTEQIDSYPLLRDQTHNALSGNTDATTIYNKWIQLAELATVKPNNAPAYMQETGFTDKTYNTLMWTYNELKHDTILYVKEPSAEMWAGGGWCALLVDVPELLVPKWYVEPQIDLIDRLLALSEETSNSFSWINKDNFALFHDYLTFVKTIAVAETQNSKIPDEDFEKLRLSYSILQQIMSPSSTYLINGEKGMRASIIADIFTSWKYGPYYLANGRPLIMVVSIDDINGKRAVLWPVYSTYEFYGKPFPAAAGRYTDVDRRAAYDTLPKKKALMSLPLQHIISQ